LPEYVSAVKVSEKQIVLAKALSYIVIALGGLTVNSFSRAPMLLSIGAAYQAIVYGKIFEKKSKEDMLAWFEEWYLNIAMVGIGMMMACNHRRRREVKKT